MSAEKYVIFTGPKGGQYYIDDNLNKRYIATSHDGKYITTATKDSSIKFGLALELEFDLYLEISRFNDKIYPTLFQIDYESLIKNLYIVYDANFIDSKIGEIHEFLKSNKIKNTYYEKSLKNVKRVIKKYSISNLNYEQLYNIVNNINILLTEIFPLNAIDHKEYTLIQEKVDKISRNDDESDEESEDDDESDEESEDDDESDEESEDDDESDEESEDDEESKDDELYSKYIYYKSGNYIKDYLNGSVKGDMLYKLVKNIIEESYMTKYLERVNPGKYFYFDDPAFEVRSEHPCNTISEVINDLFNHKRRVINDANSILKNFTVYENTYDKIVLVKDSLKSKGYKSFLREGCQLNFTLPHEYKRLTDASYLTKVKNEHITLMKAFQLIYPLILNIFYANLNIKYPIGNADCSDLACLFSMDDVDNIYNTNEVRKVPPNKFQKDFFGLISEKTGEPFDMKFVGKDFRVNYEYYNPDELEFFGFEFRLLTYDKNFRYILSILCLLAEYLKQNDITISANIINDIFTRTKAKNTHYNYSVQFYDLYVNGWKGLIKKFYVDDLKRILKLNIIHHKDMRAYDLLNEIYMLLIKSVKSVEFKDTHYMKYYEDEVNIILEELPCSGLFYRNIVVGDFFENSPTKKYGEKELLNIHKKIKKSKSDNSDYIKQWISIFKDAKIGKSIAEDLYYYAVSNNYIPDQHVENMRVPRL